MKKIVILISGRGSNLQALLEAKLPCRIAAAISNRADAGGLKIAQAHDIPTAIIEHRNYTDRDSFDAALAGLIDTFHPDFVVLAGFMRILTAGFVARYRGRLVNIHPSLLPAYGGLHTHARALQGGVKIHGCTVHFVTPDLDHGPIIIQAAVPVLCGDTEQTLAARVLHEEHRIYPQAIRWLCAGQIELGDDGRVRLLHRRQSGFALISPGLE
ncbi:MAG: phosphoribosylglycinamide formyltransferase [Gallionellales bacterium RIFCSPLOWO2_12_FULL_59_22]|nr:MAG: phosphoribosylglycinamide formyltransferase [Gallionellales bacterium RIFCSPLOWO2_02_FULL_59_110]OGT03474.1 MAG: phosphoribosylglycinamide formyltransferase [Gallionellales bacterium RIFCSPLOWO2_02_58_13]OGT13334.1 MAG: phosphoribosylglycinamide formyltransferase [Gallionellales bacterium RIFCSPLOWO2_12_FULL_59_22]